MAAKWLLAGQQVAGIGRTFLPQVWSFGINQHRSISQLPMKIHEFLVAQSWAWELFKKVRTTRRGCPAMTYMNNGSKKCIESKTGLQSCLGPMIVQIQASWSFRCSCVDFATQENVHYDKRQSEHLLLALRLEKWAAAINFPHNKMVPTITE